MNEKQILKNKVQKLESLLESSKLLSSTQDTSDILQALLNESIANIKDGDAGIIFLHNQEEDCLEVKTYIGFDSEMGNLKLATNESITGRTFTQRKPLRLNSAENISAVTNTMKPVSQKILKQIYTDVFPLIHSTISCPLIFRDHCFGVIVIDGFKENAKLTEEDLTFLESISIQAAIAINNSLSLERESKTASDLEITNRMIETQKDAYKYTLDLHTKFTNMILHGCDVADILIELSQLIDCGTIVVSPMYALIGHQLLKTQSLKDIEALQPKWIEQLSSLHTTSFRPKNIDLNLLFLPILINQENYGWLGILNPPNKQSEKHSIAIERSLAVLALILLKIQDIHSTEMRLKGEFLDTLLAYRDIDFITRTLKTYGYRWTERHSLLIIELEPMENVDAMEPLQYHSTSYLQGLQEQLQTTLQKLSPQILSFIKGMQLIFLMETKEDLSESINAEKLWTLMAENPLLWHLIEKERRIKAGVSQPFGGLENFNTAYQHANYALEIGSHQYQNDFLVFYSQLKVKRFLLNNNPQDLQSFTDDILGPLIQYDKKSNAHFLETLKIYIRTNNSWTKTKEHLFIHGNTLTYRLRRIEEILGLRLDNYRHRLDIQIAFEILELKNL